jgi:hypothetical protein
MFADVMACSIVMRLRGQFGNSLSRVNNNIMSLRVEPTHTDEVWNEEKDILSFLHRALWGNSSAVGPVGSNS